MTETEKEFVNFIKKYIWLFFAVIMTLIAVVMRLSGISFVSRDLEVFLVPWFDKMRELGGIAALGQGVGNYNVIYQTIIAIMTYIPIDPVLQYKFLSIVFDFVLAVGAAALVYELSDTAKKPKAVITYALTLILPTVVLNSSVWGQCDSIFTAFAVWSVYFLYKRKNIAAFIMLGFAFAFKLQAVFILPVFVIFYFANCSYSLSHFLIVPAVNFLVGIPAFVMGRNIFDVIAVYVGQTDTYKSMYLNCPNFYAMFSNDYSTLKLFGVFLCFAVLLLGLVYYVVRHKNGIKSTDFAALCLWSAWCCVLLLPAMHERYSYMADVLSLALAVTDKKYAWTAVVINILSVTVYGYYLFGHSILALNFLSLINTLAFALFTYRIFTDHKRSAV